MPNKMKVLPVIALMFFLAAACKTTNDAAALPENTSPTDTEVLVEAEEPKNPADSLIIAFEKTACFGRCPVYKIKVYASGFAVYEGLNFSEKMGLYATRFSQEKIERIFESAEKIEFFELASEYENPQVTDLPSTITMLNNDGKKHRIKARIGTPEKLQIFQENLSVTLNEMPWQPYSQR